VISWIAKIVEEYIFTAKNTELLLNEENNIRIEDIKIDKEESNYFIRLLYIDKEILNAN
jgi:hypothetical protein